MVVKGIAKQGEREDFVYTVLKMKWLPSRKAKHNQSMNQTEALYIIFLFDSKADSQFYL